jgi:hypothetical protein
MELTLCRFLTTWRLDAPLDAVFAGVAPRRRLLT